MGAVWAFGSCGKDDDSDPQPELLQHGELTVLQRATKGKGIDIVILGDGFTENDLELWEETLEKCKRSMFLLEPFTSFKEYFNLYAVSAVSAGNEFGMEKPGNTFFGVHKAKNDYLNRPPGYAMWIVSRQAAYRFAYEHSPVAADKGNMQDLVVGLIINDEEYGGEAFMDRSNATYLPAPADQLVGFGMGWNTLNPDFFDYLFIHETLGHAFGTLADEYTELEGLIPDNYRERFRRDQDLGIYLNVSFTGDPAEFVNPVWRALYESGYPGVGIFEGGHHYDFGVWRSSEDSIMNGLQPQFNAVSREIIVRQIYRMAGLEDQYSLDVFLDYDKINIAPTARSRSGQSDPPIALPPAWYPPI